MNSTFRCCTVLSLALYASAVGAQARSPIAPGWQTRLERYVGALDRAGFSGVVLARAGTDTVRLAAGFADSTRTVRVGPSTLFDIGSITKQFTAAAILRLEAAGKLSVSDSLARHLPNVPADKRGITLHHLLTHSAGLPSEIGPDYEPIGRAAYIERALAAPLLHRPGAEYAYSNVGYSLLAAVVEMRSGRPYDDFVRTELFAPAGMPSTGYRIPGLDQVRVATGFSGDRVWGRPNERPWATDGPYWNLRGNGGILSTADDMLRWHDALTGDRLLTAEQKRRMYTRHIEEGKGAGTYYGYGWALFPTPRGTTLITHNGGNGIFFADFLRYVDEGVVIFVATNRARREFRDIARNVARVVFDASFVPAVPAMSAGAAASGSATAALPDTDLGRLVRRLLVAIDRSDAAHSTQLVNNDYAPELVRAAPMDRHVGMIARLREAIGADPSLRRVVVRDDEVEVTIAAKDGRPVGQLIVGVMRDAAGRWRIAGIRLED